MDELRCLHELFPHASPRPGQLAALEAIARMFRESIPVLISEVPTGAGKSALALTMARYAATLTSSERGAYILTPYNHADRMNLTLGRNGQLACRTTISCSDS